MCYNSDMFEQLPSRDIFKKPTLQNEIGELRRAAQHFGIDDSVLMYLAETEGRLIPLSQEIWSQLDNTDSFNVKSDDHDTAATYASMNGRDYHQIADSIYASGIGAEKLDAPIIMKYGDQYHLVAGNTRLMACRAYGVTPNVYLFTVDTHDQAGGGH